MERISKLSSIALAAVATMVGAFAPIVASAAEALDAALGVWRGVSTERTATLTDSKGDIELRLEGTSRRFSVRLTDGGRALLTGEFQPGKRPGLMEPAAAGGFFSVFGGRKQGNPLKGAPMAWAREDRSAITFYRLEIFGGPFELDRLKIEPVDGQLRISFERRHHDREPDRLEARLERAAR